MIMPHLKFLCVTSYYTSQYEKHFCSTKEPLSSGDLAVCMFHSLLPSVVCEWNVM